MLDMDITLEDITLGEITGYRSIFIFHVLKNNDINVLYHNNVYIIYS